MLSKAFSKSIPSAKIPLGEKNRTRYNVRHAFLTVMINKLSVLILIQGRKDMEIMLSLCVCVHIQSTSGDTCHTHKTFYTNLTLVQCVNDKHASHVQNTIAKIA